MPTPIRRERLLATMHPHASATCSVRCDSSKAPKNSVIVAAKTEVFEDALEAKPDIVVRGNDVFQDPLEAPQLESSNEDPSTWWWREFATDDIMAEVNPGGLISSSTGKQGPKVKGARC
jgi:hypothetical protein